MNENELKELTSLGRTRIRTVPLIDCSIAQILKHEHSKGFRKRFINDPYLEQITPRQVLTSPLAMGDFLQRCRAVPHCGETTINRLLALLESVAAGEVDNNSGLRRVSTQ